MLCRLISDTLSAQIHDTARRRVFESPQNQRTPSISVIVPTRENPDALERHLASLARVQYQNFEIIVVDNAPKTDRTKRVCDKFPFVHRVVEPRPKLAYARNTGWQIASKEIVAYSDDNTIVNSSWLTVLAEDYAAADVHCVAGIALPSSLDAIAEQQFAGDHAMPLGFHPRRYFAGVFNSSIWLDLARLGGNANISFRRSALQVRQGFDPALAEGGSLDLLVRVIRDGGDVLYDPRALHLGQQRRTISQLRRQALATGFGFATCCTKYFGDAELANSSAKSLRHWVGAQGFNHVGKNLAAAACRQPHTPFHLILLEFAGGILATNAYRRSVRRLRNDTAKFRRKGITRRAA